MARPRVLIEENLPVEALGIESRRERGASSALPPLYFLHVWWARRPLTISRAAILASLLPADTDPQWFLEVLGIKGDPVKVYKRILEARTTGEDLGTNPYGYKRAFSEPVPETIRKELHSRLTNYWASSSITVFDPMAGGGSIPFEGVRTGMDVISNDLNPVAYVIQQATLRYPVQFGLGLVDLVGNYARSMQKFVQTVTNGIFAEQDNERVWGYLWAHTVYCPSCALEVPLSPNWWLANTKKQKVAVRWKVTSNEDRLVPEVIDVTREDYDPDKGTVKNGAGICPRCHIVIESDYIKRQAQGPGLGFQLYALAIKVKGGLEFRAPTIEDEAAFAEAERRLAENLPRWEALGWVPNEPYPEITNDPRPLYYGMRQWKDFFNPRQLLSLLTYLEAFNAIKDEVTANHPADEAKAILTYLAFALDKAADYNSRMTRFDGTRNKIANTFDRHDYAFKWSFAEMNLTAPGLGFDWAVDQVLDAYEGLCKLLGTANHTMNWLSENRTLPTVRLGSASDLWDVADASVHAVVVDPPYYDNVMYAEMADFFYVWQKRTLGDLYPEAFLDPLTDKTQEAVANPALFSKQGTLTPKAQAEQDYRNKMQGVFREIARVLRPDGVLTLMFTHKRVEAWDTLASALIDAGFEITASWPVHTESEHSLHIANKNAAESTILLACRKRESERGGWWDELLPLVRQRILERAKVFEAKGFRKLDLMLATYGPALQVLSEYWPVKDSTGQLVQPERVLEEARSLVTQLRVTDLVQHRQVTFDPLTRWYLLAWDVFGAEQFPYDEARLLAITCGVDLDRQVIREHGLAGKKGKYLILATPEERMDGHRRGSLDRAPEASVDALHLALFLLNRDGSQAAGRYLNDHRLTTDTTFQALIDACLTAIPRVRPEWQAIHILATAYFRTSSQVLEQIQWELSQKEG
ncbi:protein of unknown function DUF1156 [Sulfobacillus acidophilus TPY]|uniref:DUF1156 domain-containing protein n=1 Tax=Sulfobacillus acidophilus (strain ATCC 700253 / DSM 10332 / NAL) TaxID=679936 RepID=G8TVK0_SULAD|nr:protein of unknown function DUF1156 [Sulfobacillus acidophilus TPY]AEW03639.1 protein of unknown function DUF1156 [Sulfobacillus acidophilus DSM 10332]